MYHKSIRKDVWRMKKGEVATLVLGDEVKEVVVNRDYGCDLISARDVGADINSNRFYDLREWQVRG